MDVADGLAEVLVPPFALLVIVDGKRLVAFWATARIAYELQVEMEHLHAVVESAFGRIDHSIGRLYSEDEPHRILQGDVRARVSLGGRDHDLVFPAL